MQNTMRYNMNAAKGNVNSNTEYHYVSLLFILDETLFWRSM